MAKAALSVVVLLAMIAASEALLALIVTLPFAFLKIMKEADPTAHLLALAQLLLSWPVIAGVLGISGAIKFRPQIQGVLNRIARLPDPSTASGAG